MGSAAAPSSYEPIGDYALVGDCHGAALVSRAGSVDWCALGRFDAGPVLWRLLDAGRGGFLSVCPAVRAEAARAYLPGTNILRTTFAAAEGEVAVTDFMPLARRWGSRTHDYTQLRAPGWLVRIVEGRRGALPMTVAYRPGSGFAPRPPPLNLLPGQVAAAGGPSLYHDLPRLACDGDGASATFVLEAGQRYVLVLAARPVTGLAPLAEVDRLLAVTRALWEEWIGYCRYQGPYRDQVQRSALVLKLLTYAPSGAIVAAPTTSLPEVIGGSRNWDYRYCWLRDSAFTLYALALLGYGGEARRFCEFLCRAAEFSTPELQIMYGIGCERELDERELWSLRGYRDSRPVRVGNAAYRQRQIDVYGEVLDWALLYRALGGRIDRPMRRLLGRLADFVAGHWHEPDAGLWEQRGPPRHHVHGKLMCWVALDRAARLLGDRAHWRAARERVLHEVLEHGVDPEGGHLLQAFGCPGTDASLLQVPLLAVPLDARIVEATVAAVERELARGELVYRYRGEDGLEGEEGAFSITSFWLVDALLATGRCAEAQALFERVLARGNDLGLFAEEIDPASGQQLGNFPQAFTHLALIGSAVHLELVARHGPGGMAGGHAARASRATGAVFGWRALWAAFLACRRVGRIRSSRRSMLPPGWPARAAH